MAKEFNILIAEDADYSEIVDTIADVFGVGITIENALSDGFQLTDILTAVQLEPTVREVVNDFPVFIDQFTKLSGTTAMAAVSEAKMRTEAQYGGDLGKIGNFIYGVLTELASTYGFIENTVLQGMEKLNAWKKLVATLKEAE